MNVLNILNFKDVCREILEQHDSGLITDYELVAKIVEASINALPEEPKKGDLDANTGLRY